MKFYACFGTISSIEFILEVREASPVLIYNRRTVTLRLHSRLVFLNGCTIAIIILLLGYYLDSSIRRTLESEIESELSRSAVLGKAYLDLQPDRTDPSRLVRELAKALNARVTIIAASGVVLGDSDLSAEALRTVENYGTRPEVVDALKSGRGISIRRSAAVGASFIYVAILDNGQILRLARPLSGVDQMIGGLNSQLVVALVASLGITLIFGYMVYALVSRPLNRMAEASQQLALGNLGQDIPVVGDSDLARVGSSLNAMARSIRVKIDELMEDKTQIEAIIEAMSAGVVVFDRNARVVLANNAIRQVLGIAGQPVGRTPLELVRHSAVDAAVRQAFGRVDVPNVDLTTPGGKVLSAKAMPVTRLSGNVEQVVVVFHDLTDLRRIERMRRDFVANVSHEFKTPLTSIRGYVETLLTDPPAESAVVQEFLQAIERNARLLQALVEDLLVLAMLERELPVERVPVDVGDLVAQQVQAKGRLLQELDVKVRHDGVTGTVLADPARLSRAVSNLLDNAIQYNRPGGTIEIAGRDNRGTFELTIADTGMGIPQQDLSRIFERFYRVEKSRSSQSGATGLGLAIAKHAIESQGGSISVASTAGSGSVFSIHLPTA